MESSKGESEKSQSIKLNVILSVPPLFYILYPPLEPFCHPPPFRQKGAFLSYRKLCFHTIKKLRLGCALGAGVDGCRSNRASARECAKAHSFLAVTIAGILPCGKLCRRLKGIVLQYLAGSQSAPCLFRIQVRSRTC